MLPRRQGDEGKPDEKNEEQPVKMKDQSVIPWKPSKGNIAKRKKSLIMLSIVVTSSKVTEN